VGVILGWRQIQAELRVRKVQKLRDSIHRSGQEQYVLNFITRFRMEGEGNRGWSFLNHHFDWNRIADLEKVLVERGVPLNLQVGKRDIFTVLRLFIQEKEESLTRASIERAPQLFSQLRGDDFEKLLCRLFEAMGYVVQHVGKSGDQGGDVIANKDGERILIQAKCYRDWSVGNAAVQQAVAAMKYYDCNKTMVITTSVNFTKEAVALAQANATELVSKPRLSELLATHLGQAWR
jgi:HJR/Mrr/RecB family endonuclease